jgi:hypothetical protein
MRTTPGGGRSAHRPNERIRRIRSDVPRRGGSRGRKAVAQTEAAGGISLGGILVIVGIVLMIVWSFWVGLIVALVGLVAFGGFAKGKWY